MSRPKLALVTGGSRGIGIATVKLLCEHSIRTLFTCRNPHDGQSALMELARYAKFLDYHPLEVSDNDSVAAILNYVEKKYGYLDILINNAGANYDSWQRVTNVAIPEVEYTLSVNLMGPWRMCNAFLPLLMREGGGRIVNVSSGAGTIASQDGSTPAYSLSKCGVNMLTKSLAADLSGKSVAVNAADPGWVRTSMGGEEAPLSPRDGADTIVWLATEVGKAVTGGLYRKRKLVDW